VPFRRIPSKPKGDIVKNGVVLYADKIYVWGNFVHSSFDSTPVPPETSHDELDNAADKTYQPPEKNDELNHEVPATIY
jgi:hypothetical protein